MVGKTGHLIFDLASAMGIKRYETLRRYIHVTDNSTKDLPENKNDKLFKIRPLHDMVRNNCLKNELGSNHSIDEQIVPAKTKQSGGVRQHNPKKIHKWGFKNMVRAGKSGIIYDFFMYGGKNSAGFENCGAEQSVLRLVQNLPKHKSFHVFFDNWFSTLSLIIQLKTMGILTTATFRQNRTAGCPLRADKELKKFDTLM